MTPGSSRTGTRVRDPAVRWHRGQVHQLPGPRVSAPGFHGASVVVNWCLFLPGSCDPASPKAGRAKVARRDKCAITAEVGHVQKWQLALDMIDETRSWGIEVPQVIADGGYGDTAAFRLGLETWSRPRGGHLDQDHRATRRRTDMQPGLLRPRTTPGSCLPRAGPAGEEPGHRGR